MCVYSGHFDACGEGARRSVDGRAKYVTSSGTRERGHLHTPEYKYTTEKRPSVNYVNVVEIRHS